MRKIERILISAVDHERLDQLIQDRKPLPAEKIKQVVDMTLNDKPPNATQWSARSMAAAAGNSHSSVHRIWQAHGLKPHLVKTFKRSAEVVRLSHGARGEILEKVARAKQALEWVH